MSEFEDKAGELYETLEEHLSEADCEMNAAELQGVLAGMAAVGLKSEDHAWQKTIQNVIVEGNNLDDATLKVIKLTLAETIKSFAEQDCLAPILVPGDDYPLIDRLEALALWSQGFLLGFGLQLGNTPIENKEVQESLHDLSEISQIELSQEDSEEAQTALETLIEHIKVAVQVIYLELVVKKDLIEINTNQSSATYH